MNEKDYLLQPRENAEKECDLLPLSDFEQRIDYEDDEVLDWQMDQEQEKTSKE